MAVKMKRSVLVLLAPGQVSQFGCSITASESKCNCGVDREEDTSGTSDIQYVESVCVYIDAELVQEGHKRPHTHPYQRVYNPLISVSRSYCWC